MALARDFALHPEIHPSSFMELVVLMALVDLPEGARFRPRRSSRVPSVFPAACQSSEPPQRPRRPRVVDRMAEIGNHRQPCRETAGARTGQCSAEEATLLGIQRGALVTSIRRTYYSDDARPVETAGLVIPAATCEIFYEVPASN